MLSLMLLIIRLENITSIPMLSSIFLGWILQQSGGKTHSLLLLLILKAKHMLMVFIGIIIQSLNYALKNLITILWAAVIIGLLVIGKWLKNTELLVRQR